MVYIEDFKYTFSQGRFMKNSKHSSVSQAVVAVTLVLACMASTAQPSKQKPLAVQPAVAAFYSDAMHCSDMVAVNENQTDEEAQRFTTDIGKAVASLRAATPSLTLDGALLQLKAGCDKQLLADARGAGNAAKPKIKQ
jgi:hypothetical protein